MKLIASSQLIFAGSADTQIFLVDEKEQFFLISFSGFLNRTTDSLDMFRSDEVIIYTGSNINRIKETVLKRSAENMETEHHSFRQFDITPELKEQIINWLFSSETLQSLD